MLKFKSFFLSFVFFTTTFILADLASEEELYTGKEFQSAFANPQDNPELPNVLLIGDSISIGYTLSVRKELKDKADVYRISTNGRHTEFGLANIEKWLGKLGNKEFDVIHFNWGLWDICYRNPEATTQGKRDKVHGTLTTTPEDYKKNLESIVERLQKTGAKLIWCATTPVPENEIGRKVGDEVKYNLIAEAIMLKEGVAINDLHTYANQSLPTIQKLNGDVHFTSEGSAYLAKQVVKTILEQLAVKSK